MRVLEEHRDGGSVRPMRDGILGALALLAATVAAPSAQAHDAGGDFAYARCENVFKKAAAKPDAASADVEAARRQMEDCREEVAEVLSEQHAAIAEVRTLMASHMAKIEAGGRVPEAQLANFIAKILGVALRHTGSVQRMMGHPFPFQYAADYARIPGEQGERFDAYVKELSTRKSTEGEKLAVFTVATLRGYMQRYEQYGPHDSALPLAPEVQAFLRESMQGLTVRMDAVAKVSPLPEGVRVAAADMKM